MEQLRLTLPELEQEERQIRENLGGIVKNFVRTGWHLSRIDRSGAYKLKGFSTISEYARATFGMAPDGVSRFMSVYEKYSVPGDTPELRAEYQKFNFSQLTEMLQLPEGDHHMIRPETKREDIRDLKKFNKQSEHNPDNLLNWQQESDDIILEAVREFFKEREKDLNGIYEQYGTGPYTEENTKKMARFLYHEKKKKFQTDRVFMMLYPDQVFIKSSDGELHDITWPEFFQTMSLIFDKAEAGSDTWENYFNPDEEQIPGQDNIMNHPEYIPGKLHGRKFEHCMYFPEEDCIAEDCGGCQKKQVFEQREDRERAVQKNGRCLYHPESPCTLTAEQKATPGDGENCEEKCCWNCSEENCKYKCNVSANWRQPKEQEEDEQQEKKLKKPNEEERNYMNQAAKHLIYSLFDWMREDHMNRVTMVDRSPKELKEKLGANGRTRWFSTENGTAHINLFDDYVQIWDEKNNCLGDYDWFYLAASIQSMWNVVSLEKAQEKEPKDRCQMGLSGSGRCGSAYYCSEPVDCCAKCRKDCNGRCGWINKPEVKESEIVPAQTEENKARNPDAWPSDLQDIPIPSMTAIKDYLTEEEKILKDYLECVGLPKQLILRQQLKVAGLRMIRNLTEDAIEEETEQPELPRLKNNDERKEWLENYQDWGLWYRDEKLDVNYYKYDFKDGSRLVAAEYPMREGYWNQKPRDEHFFHFLKKNKKKYAAIDEVYDEKFRNETDSITSLVEFLKEIQK